MRHSTTYYVSLSGHDGWSGRLSEPSTSKHDGPFRTLERARDAVRDQRARAPGAAVRVLIRGGVHTLRRTLVLTAADSGTAATPVVYAAFEGEAPVLSGGRRIEGLRVGQVHGRACWVADLRDVKAGKWSFTQLFVNGQRRWRARFPHAGFCRFAGLPEGSGRRPRQALFREGELRRWRNLRDVEIVSFQHWFDSHVRIESVDVARRLVRFNQRMNGSLIDESGQPARYFAENVFEALTEPGTWYLDRPRGRFTYIPLPDERIETVELIAPRLENLVAFKGTPGQPVAHIRLENLAFQHAEWTNTYADADHGQASFHVPGAITLKDAEHCALYGCSISRISQYGVEILEGCHGNAVVACAITDMGAGGVKVGHEWLDRHGPCRGRHIRRRPNGKPSASIVADCAIHDGSLIYRSAIGIWVGNAGFNRILHNHVHHLNYTGISCGWTWGYQPTATSGDRIEGNHVHHINWQRVLSDNGGIYTLGQRPGCVLRRNHVHHIHGHGIYHDEGTSEQRVEQNLVHHVSGCALATHYGRDNVVRNNIFALTDDLPFVLAGRREAHRTTVFERNVVCWRNGVVGGGSGIVWPLHGARIRDNLFWAEGRALDFGHDSRLADWQRTGQFLGTLIADPLFQDPDGDGFALRSDSPALRTGFLPWDVAAAGPRDGASRPAGYDAWRARHPLPAPGPILRTALAMTPAQRVRLTVTNVGGAAASGRLRLAASPADAVALTGDATFSFQALMPGQTRSAEFDLAIAHDHTPLTIETMPKQDAFLPALLYVKPADHPWEVRRLQDGGKDKPLPWAPADVVRRIVYAGHDVAEFRVLVAGTTLVLGGTIVDRRIRRDDLLWNGSVVECFVAPWHKGLPATPRQLFLVPAEDARTLDVLLWRGGKAVPLARITTHCQPTAHGYRFDAHVPLELVGLPHDVRRFMMELLVGTVLSPTSGKQGRLALFDARAPERNAAGYGMIRVGGGQRLRRETRA